MSRMIFHAYKQECVALPAWETASLIMQSFDVAFDLLWPERSLLDTFFRSTISFGQEAYRQQFIGASLMGRILTVGGRDFELSTLSLNTALGSEKHRLAARLFGQHEIHCYVEGPNRPWLAAHIERGLESGSLRREIRGEDGSTHDCGWQGVLTFLLANERYPAVFSGSVTDSPGSVSPRSRWMGQLRERDIEDHLELKPEGWEAFRFGDGMDASHLLEAAVRASGARAARETDEDVARGTRVDCLKCEKPSESVRLGGLP